MKNTIIFLMLALATTNIFAQSWSSNRLKSGKLLAFYSPKKEKRERQDGPYCDGQARVDERTAYFLKNVLPTNDTQKIGQFINTGINLNSAASESYLPEATYTILAQAIYSCNAITIRYLLDKGANANLRARLKRMDVARRTDVYLFSWYPLEYAVDRRNIDMVQALIDHGARYELCLEGMKRLATANNDFPMLAYIGKLTGTSAVQPDAIPVMLRSTGQHDANQVTPEAIRYLVRQGADINAYDPFGRTALLNVIQGEDIRNKIVIMKALLDNGANPNKGDVARGQILMKFYSTTPLMAAVRRGNLDMVKLLIDRGADATEKQLLESSNTPQIKEYLILHGAR